MIPHKAKTENYIINTSGLRRVKKLPANENKNLWSRLILTYETGAKIELTFEDEKERNTMFAQIFRRML